MKLRIAPVVLLSVALLGCGSEEEVLVSTTSSEPAAATSTTEQTPPVTIAVTVGVDSGPERTESVALGSKVTLEITNPTDDDELHLHGYDLSTGDVAKGETASISFTADQAGEFEVESHVSEEVVLVIIVK